MPKAIIVEVLGDASHFSKTLDKAAGRTRNFGRVAGVVGTAIAGGLALGLERSVAAAVDAQDSQRRLTQAFKITGLQLDTYKGSIDAAEDSGRKLGFTDTQVRDSLGSLITATGNVTTSMKDLKVAQNLARFTGKDLTTTTKYMTSAMSGSQRAIKALGLSVVPVTKNVDALKREHVDLTTAAGKARLAHAKLLDKLATGKAVVDAAAKATRGQAQAFADTAAGGMEQFRAQLDHLEVGLGKGVLPALTKVAEALGKFVGFLSDHQTFAKVLAVGLGVLAGALIAVAGATTLVELAMSPLLVPVLAITAAMVLLGVAIYEGIKHWDDIKAAMSAVWDWIKGTFIGVWDDLKNAITSSWDAIKTAASVAWDAIKSVIETAWNGIVWIFEHLTIAGLILTHWNQIRTFTTNLVTDVVTFFTELPGKIKDGFVTAWDAVKGGISGALDFVKTHASGIITSVVGFFEELPGKIGDAIGGAMHFLKDKLGELFSWKKIVGWIKDALGFGSPSPHFMAIGHDIVDSMIRGVGESAGMLKNAVENLAKKFIPSLSAPSGTGLAEGSGHLVGRVLNALDYARQHGWSGSVISGYRSYAEQAALYQRYVNSGFDPRYIAARPGTSSHERGEAVDVSQAGVFDSLMNSAPLDSRLYNLVPGDFNHFSVSGYDKGGWLMPGLTLAMNNTGRPERVLGPGGGGDTYQFVFPNYVGSRDELVETVHSGFLEKQRRSGGKGSLGF